MKIFARVLRTSVVTLTRAACICALVGLSLMAYSIVDPRPIPVIAAMSVGHVFGIGAFVCYLLAIVLDIRSRGGADSASTHSE
jgi:hypothetical protein